LRAAGPLWREALYLAILDDLPPFVHPLTIRDIAESKLSTEDETTKAVISKINKFVEEVEQMELIGVWQMKPLVNGQEIQQLLGIPPGPRIKTILDQQIEWQLQHPKATKDECIAWLMSNK